MRTSITVWLFGLMSGFTLMITGNTLNYWLSKEGINLKVVGIFALVSLPYAINFIWAPIFDTLRIWKLTDIFGIRRSWLYLIQICLAAFVFILSTVSLESNLELFALICVVISLCSSAQDTILGALRTEIVSPQEQGAVSGMYIFGYRTGMLLSGSAAIYFWDVYGAMIIYQIFALFILLFPMITILINDKNPSEISVVKIINSNKGATKLLDFIQSILKPVGSWSFIALVLIFLILYRLPDNFISTMINPFLIQMGYSSHEIGTVGKFFGIFAAIIGGFVGSKIMKKQNIFDSLMIFGIIHAIAHILFIFQDFYGKSLGLLFVVIGFESITGGMSMAAYIALIASLCHGKFRATQYSFFSAMMGFSRSVLPAISGYIVSEFNWQIFFIFTTLATIPALLLIPILKRKMFRVH